MRISDRRRTVIAALSATAILSVAAGCSGSGSSDTPPAPVEPVDPALAIAGLYTLQSVNGIALPATLADGTMITRGDATLGYPVHTYTINLRVKKVILGEPFFSLYSEDGRFELSGQSIKFDAQAKMNAFQINVVYSYTGVIAGGTLTYSYPLSYPILNDSNGSPEFSPAVAFSPSFQR